MNNPADDHKATFHLWARARSLAMRTPDTRNRYVDFLRALSILAVISGHWVMAAPSVTSGEFVLGHLLSLKPWTQWLTWGFQVMPVFFLVGGYANGVSWRAAVRDRTTYGQWLSTRLQRLIGPVLVLVLVWGVLGAIAQLLGGRPQNVGFISQAALIPIWFLSVYIVVVVMVPLTWRAWDRFGLASFWVLGAAALLNDVLFFAADMRAVGWINYVFVWVAIHQLGYAWRDGRLQGYRRALLWACGGLLLLVFAVTVGPYPTSMVGVPGEGISNTTPPKLPILALGLFQTGLLLSIENRAQRWLAKTGPWTATLLINGMIMTIYLWHLTASTLVMGLAFKLGGLGLDLEPGTGLWWSLRPAWVAAYVAVLLILTLLFNRLERGGTGASKIVAPWRLVCGALLSCGGLAMLALNGVAGDQWLGLRVYALCLPFLGAWLAGLLPSLRDLRRVWGT